IIGEIFAGEHDILIKATRKHDMLESVIFTPTDWHLMRKCPTPVLLVKNADWPENANIIASVHVGSELDTHIDLNDRMVEQLLNLSKRLGASPYLVNAYPVTPANITIELPEFDPTTYTDAVRGHHLTAMKALRQKHGLSEEQTLVQQGLPEDVIPEAAKQLNAAMVILGTTGRTGLSAVFIGNTAEHVIDKINCDVLALKPNGYVSPLDPQTAI
nr:universal stress protein UspE [Vibrio cholerae]